MSNEIKFIKKAKSAGSTLITFLGIVVPLAIALDNKDGHFGVQLVLVSISVYFTFRD